MAFQLPSPGDVQGQAQSGMNLINQIQQGQIGSLLDAGIATGASAIGGPGAAVLMDIVGGALSGFAMAGPMGAAAGAVEGFAEAVISLFQGGPDEVTGFVGLSAATQTITKSVLGLLGQHQAILSGNPQGWAMSDWAATVFPPNSSPNASKFMSLMKTTAKYVASQGFLGVGMPGEVPPTSTNGGPTSIANALCSGGSASGSVAAGGGYSVPCNSFSAQGFLNDQQPLCTPVWFDWSQQGQIADCSSDLYFGSGGAGGDPSTLYNRWVESTYAQNGLTQAQIVARAMQQLPDPLYWSVDLYGCAVSSNGGYATTYYNLDGLNAMATILMMRSSGASTQAIVSELLIQSAILQQTGNKVPGGASLPGSANDNHCVFYSLLDDHIRMAQAENAAAVSAAGAQLSVAGKVGAVALGATGTILAGILAYSVYSKTSPVTVTRETVARVERLRRFL
jgi:hypothetical protein